jgi:hypothetical protein
MTLVGIQANLTRGMQGGIVLSLKAAPAVVVGSGIRSKSGTGDARAPETGAGVVGTKSPPDTCP